jgi:hypothetical protein
MQSAKYEQQAYNNRAFMSEMEARDFEQQAKLEQASTQFEAERLRKRIDATRASQRASAAASGVSLSGSTQQFISSNAEEQELDALMLRFNGMSRQLGRERSAQMARGNATTLRAEGTVARSQGNSRAFSSLLTGAGKSASTYYSLGGKYGRNWF